MINLPLSLSFGGELIHLIVEHLDFINQSLNSIDMADGRCPR